MKPMKYKTRESRTLSLLILVALLAVLSAPSLTDSVAYAQDPAPPDLTATSRVAGEVELSWTEVSGATYVVARYDRTARRWDTLSNRWASTTLSDDGVQAGRTYVYQVSADGRNTWSNQESVFVGHYDAPTLNAPTVSTLPGKIDVSWSTVAGVDDYDLWRFEQTEGWRQVADGQAATTYADTAVDIGKAYLYQVQAHGTLGAGAWSSQQSATVPQTAPSAPQNFAAAAADAMVSLTWDTPLYDGGSVVTGYQYRYQMSGGNWSDWTASSPALSRAVTISNLTNDSDYNFEVRAQNAIGDGAVATDSAMPMSTVPGTPTGLGSTSIGPNEIMLTWNTVAGATGYELQRRVNGESWVMLTGVTGTAHTDSGLTPSTSYDYEVRATNASGSSPWSGAVTLETAAPQEPAAPTLSASATNFTITLTWTAPNDGGAAITHYEIQSSPDGSTWTTLVPEKGATATMHEDMNLMGGTVKHYRIRAVNSVGNGAWSTAVMANVAPAAPVLSAEAGYRQVVLTWTQGGDAPVTSYRIEKLNAQSAWATETTLPGTTDPLRHTDTGLADSTVHTYRIVAINAAGESGPSSSADATTLAEPVQAPGMPTSLSATSGPGMVTLNWAAPLFNGGVSVSEYQYRYREAPSSTTAWGSERWMSAGDKLKAEVKPLKPATEYEFQVRALNSAGAGDPATLDDDSTQALIDARTPGATGPTAVPVLRTSLGTHAGTTAGVLPHQSNATITLSWDSLGGAAQNGGSPITGYQLCYKKSTDSAWMSWDATADAFAAPVLTGSVYSAVHGGDVSQDSLLDPGTTYQYRARAMNLVTDTAAETCTTFEGDWSTMVSRTTPAVEPAAPMLHTSDGTADPATTPATPAGTAWDLNVNSITIRWTAPATNGGADITSYEVWVGTTSVTAAEDIAALSPTVTNLPAVRLEYISVGLTSEQTYYYRVRARNGSGNDRVSVWSVEQSGTTTATQAGTPGAPTGLAVDGAVTAAGNVPLEWVAPTDHGNSPITHYEVQYQRDDDPDDDDDWSDATTVTATVASWTHMDAPGGSTMEYRVRAVNASGAGAWSDNDGGTDGAQPLRVPVAIRGPSAPMLTATAAGSDEILLQWNIPQANGTTITDFVIQRWTLDLDADGTADDPGWDATNAITIEDEGATFYSDRGVLANDGSVTTPLMAGTTYYYRIRAVPQTDVDGSGSADNDGWSATMMSDAASATTDKDVPAMPTLGVGDGDVTPTGFPNTVTLAAATTAPTMDTITLYWIKPGDGGSDITGYDLQVWDGAAWMDVVSPAADATSYAHEDLDPGMTYYYRLRASNDIGDSPWSADVSGMTVAGYPDAPELTATPTSSTSIRLTWTVPDDNGRPITGYQLQRWDTSTDPAGWAATNLLTGADIADADAETVTEFVDTGVTAGTKYYYRIRALPQADATSGWSADDLDDVDEEATATTPGNTLGRPTLGVGDGGTPTATGHTVAVAAPTASTITLWWEAPTVAPGGKAITGYDVQIWDGSTWIDEASVGAVLTYRDSGLMAGTRYYYRVRAKNPAAGPWSGFVGGDTADARPDAPVLTATTQDMETIRLTWTVPDSNGQTITGYRLQRWSSADNRWPTTGEDGYSLVTDTGTVTLHVDEGLEPGTMYHYRIQTLASGATAPDDASAWSATRSDTTVAGRPSKPTLMAAAVTGQNDAIDLSWSFDDTTPANGSAIYRYELQMWDKDARMWVNVRNDLPSTRTSYRHSGLTAETRYVYRIRAINRAADNDGEGHWSTIKFAITNK